MTEQTETTPRSPFAAFAGISATLAEAFPGYIPRTDGGADDEGPVDAEQARAIRAFALEQSINTQTAVGAAGHTPDALNKAIIERAAKFATFIEGADS